MSPSVETLSVSDNVSVYSDSESDICQLDGNDSVCLDNVNIRQDKITAALNLPTVATYNLRSLFPKVESLKKDLLERKVDVGFLT